MNTYDAYCIVYKDLTKKEGLFTGKYDVKHGNKAFMYGVLSVMQYIAYNVGEGCMDDFIDRFFGNMEKSEQERKKRDE